MGGYLISLEKEKIENQVSIFEERGQNISLSYNGESLAIKKYNKILFKQDPYIFEDDQVIITASGTFSCNGLSTLHGFDKLKNELISGHKPELFGHYTISYFNKNEKKLILYFDEAGYGAPYVIERKLISSSFLACCQYSAKLHLDHESIFEEIYTGCYFNGKTSFEEIRKVIKEENWKYNEISISFIPLKNKPPKVKFNTRMESLNYQADILMNYFQNWSAQIIENKGDLGLSSGYDSRLILGLLNDTSKNNYQVHSYWKKRKDFDNQVGERIASLVDKKLITIPISDRSDLSTENFKDLLKRAMIYYDGLFPSNHGWTREYRTIEHRIKILGNSRFGLSGISGEQYRNDFHLLKKPYSINSIIENLVLEGQNNEVLSQSKFSSQGIEILKESIYNGLSIPSNRIKLSREEIQRFYCEMWVTGGPGIRNQIENQVSYFLSPFTERYLQEHSYSIIPFLGIGGRFQAELIKLINPKLAGIISDYGFSFDHVPITHDLLAYVSALLGRKRKIKLKTMINPKQDYLNSFEPHKKIIENKLEYLKQFSFQFPIKSTIFEQDTYDRLIALSTLLQHFGNKLNDKKH